MHSAQCSKTLTYCRPPLVEFGVWGRDWANAHVLVRCDNIAVVEAKSSHNKLLMHMVLAVCQAHVRATCPRGG